MKSFMTNLLSMQTDLIQYRQYTSEVKKRVLWPKVLTNAEIEAIKERDALEQKAREEAELRAAEEALA